MSLSKGKIKKYSLLKHKKYREKEGLFLVQGRKAVNDVSDLFDIEETITDRSDIEKISTLENLPDIITVCHIPRKDIPLIVNGNNFYLVLDGIQDPGNLGTIIRTAHWFGIKQIFCSEDTVDVYNPKTIQSTMGSIGKIDIKYCNLIELFDNNKNINVYGLSLAGEDIFKINGVEPGFIVMGNEGHGLRASTQNQLTHLFTIPPKNNEDKPESLNVAIATAITLAQLIK